MISKLTYIAIGFCLVSMSFAAKMDVSDVEDDTMKIKKHSDDTVKEALTLPENASDRARERAENREGHGLSNANANRMKPHDSHGKPDKDHGPDHATGAERAAEVKLIAEERKQAGLEKAEAAKAKAEDAQDAAATAAEKAKDALEVANERAIDAVKAAQAARDNGRGHAAQ